MSEKTYNNSRDLYPEPPIYDIYVTGSDQTWSPKVGLRDSLFLGFAPKGKIKSAYRRRLLPQSAAMTLYSLSARAKLPFVTRQIKPSAIPIRMAQKLTLTRPTLTPA